MSREDKINTFLRRNVLGSDGNNVNTNNQTNNQSLMQTNQQQYEQFQVLPNPSANLMQLMQPQPQPIHGFHQASVPPFYQRAPQQQHVGISSQSNMSQYAPPANQNVQGVQYSPAVYTNDPNQIHYNPYPQELYHSHQFHEGFHPANVYHAQNANGQVEANAQSGVAQHPPNYVFDSTEHFLNLASIAHNNYVAVFRPNGLAPQIGSNASSVASNASASVAGNTAVNRLISESGSMRFTADESLRVNPNLRRTMTSRIGEITVQNQEFWARQNNQNEPILSESDVNNNNSLTENKSCTFMPEKMKEAPLQMENITGELKEYVDNTTCAICTDLFDDPRILPCGHTFCYECIEALITAQKNEIAKAKQNSQDICCPVCRASIYQIKDAKKLTKNFTVKCLVETVRISAKNKATEEAAKNLAIEFSSANLQMKTRIKNLQKHAVVMGRKFKVPQRITGVAQIGKKIYVTTESSNKLLIFDKNSKKPDTEILMQGVSQPKDIAGNDKLEFLLVVDSGSCSICRVFISGSKKDDINTFITGINEPFNIYLSNTKGLVTKLDRKDRTLCTYKADPINAKCVQKISLPSSLKHSTHAVQTADGFYYVCHSLLGDQGGCDISKIDNAGNILFTLNKEFLFGGPFFYLALAPSGDIIASEGSLKSLLKFDQTLNTCKIIWKLKEGLVPWKINCYENTLAVAYESECLQTFEI